MRRLTLLFGFITFYFGIADAQDIFIFHPKKSEDIKVFDSKKTAISTTTFRRRQGDKFKIKIINPNPLFYKYEITYEEQKEETEDKEITNLLDLFNTILVARTSRVKVDNRMELQADNVYNDYVEKVNTLMTDIKLAKEIINKSDIPEYEPDALAFNRNGGLKYAVDQVTGLVPPGIPLRLSSDQYRFLNADLEKDFNDLLKKVADVDDLTRRALQLLNNSLIKEVNDLKSKMIDVQTELSSEFTVTDKTAKIFLTIKAIDPQNASLVRKIIPSEAKFEIATIIPDYKRSVIELVPLGNFLFAQNIDEFYIENDLVLSRPARQTTFTAGMMLNFNVLRFGDSKEMALGIGPGYRLSSNSEFFENFNATALFSYKSFFRLGLGFGFAQYPFDLKDGAQVGKPLPSNISNLADVINYKEKPTFSLSISFTGLDLSKKK